MSLIKTAVTTTAQAVGFAKGLAQSGVDVVRRRGSAPESVERAESFETPRSSVVPEERAKRASRRAPQEPVVEESTIPGPDIVLAEPPAIDDLPEPIVIEADDHPGANGEAFQHEPHATTRAETVGGTAGDVFEAEDEADVALEDLPDQRP